LNLEAHDTPLAAISDDKESHRDVIIDLRIIAYLFRRKWAVTGYA
jgi:hypothetical protein